MPDDRSDTTPAVPRRMATDLLRMARHPRTGRVRRGGTLDIALRAALLCDLVLDGRVVDTGRAPAVPDDEAAEPVGDHIADTLVRTIDRRPDVAWWRWYRHVRVDREALTKELVESGVWTPTGGVGPMVSYDDVEPSRGPALGFELNGVLESRDASDLRRSLLAMLMYLSGADGRSSHPRALRRDLKEYAQTVRSGGPTARSAMAAVHGCTIRMRRRLRR